MDAAVPLLPLGTKRTRSVERSSAEVPLTVLRDRAKVGGAFDLVG